MREMTQETMSLSAQLIVELIRDPAQHSRGHLRQASLLRVALRAEKALYHHQLQSLTCNAHTQRALPHTENPALSAPV